jgi:threonine dehydratase
MAMESEKPVATPIEGTLADGLAVPMVGYNAWETAKSLVDKMVVVKEEWIAVAILRMVELEKCVVEGAGAVGLAAILAGQLNEFKGKRLAGLGRLQRLLRTISGWC